MKHTPSERVHNTCFEQHRDSLKINYVIWIYFHKFAKEIAESFLKLEITLSFKSKLRS